MTVPLPAVEVAGRVERLRGVMAEAGSDGRADALLVTNPANVRWLTGFTGSSGEAVVLADRLVLLTDGRYADRAAEELASVGVDADLAIGQTQAELRDLLAGIVDGCRRLGLEAEHVTWARRDRLAASVSPELVPTAGLVEGLRRRKDAGEVARIERAAAIAGQALVEVLPELDHEPSEVAFALALERRMEDLGAEAPSFPTIVASGQNAARPHHRPGERRVGEGDTVIIDFGARVDGYCSDMTRTAVLGTPSALQHEVFEVVRAAQAAGVAAVRPGIGSRELDAVCRDVITAAGWGAHFPHGTGHGVGLAIHEVPWVTRSHDDRLAVGDVVTVEPGVYRGDFGGVRIEDTVVVTDEGCRSLTHTPKDLAWLPSPRTT